MRWIMGFVYGLHFASIGLLLAGACGMMVEVRGARGYDVNPNFAKRLLSRRRVMALGVWGAIATGSALALGGVEIGFVAGRLGFPRQLPPGLFLPYLLGMVLLIAAALHPMLAITYRIVPALAARPGNLAPPEAEALVRRLRGQLVLLHATVLGALGAGALRWLYASAVF